MGKCLIKELNLAEIQLENIFLVMERFNFCKDMAATIVGGPRKLEQLIASGKISAEKRSSSQNGKWQCNAAQVLRHCRNMRK